MHAYFINVEFINIFICLITVYLTGDGGNSAKVFSALSWNWSSKSLQFKPDVAAMHDLGEPCAPGAHCVTLAKLYAAEQKLYKDVKVKMAFDS